MNKIIILIDVSWSMQHYIMSIIQGLNKFISKYRNIPDTNISIITFNENINYVRREINIKEVKNISTSDIICQGMTRLYDVVGNVMNEWGLKYEKTTLFIISDGDDNGSFKFSKSDIEKLSNEALLTNKWNIINCNTDINVLNIGKNIKYELNELENLLNGLNI